MVETNDALDALAKPATLCAFCPKMCRFSCPVSEAEARETVTPWAKMSLVFLARQKKVSLDDTDVHQALEACTGCGSCVESCAHGNPVAETLFVARDIAQTPRAQRHLQAFEETGDVKRRDLDKAMRALPRDARAPVAYFPGCTRLTEDGPTIDRDRRALQKAAGNDVPVCDLPERGACCGYPLYADGQLDALAAHLSRLTAAMEGHEIVVTPDPGCAYVLSVVKDSLLDEDEAKKWPKVIPVAELLATNVEAFAGASDGLTVRYHDPCYLGRRGRTFGAPRSLLASACGKAPLEFASHHDDADCSGAGGLYPTSAPKSAKRAAHKRAFEDPAVQAGPAADIVVTACPSARKNFERAGAVAVDLVDVVLGEVDGKHRKGSGHE